MQVRSMKRRRGFTLVELLVVIAIIGVLVSMLLPALNKARKAAVRTACATQLRQFANAFQMYLNDNRGWFPAPNIAAGGFANDQVTMGGDGFTNPITGKWVNFSLSDLWNRHYLDSRKIALCPAFDRSIAEGLPYWYGWVNVRGFVSSSTSGGSMSYLYLPWTTTVYSLFSNAGSGIYGQDTIRLKSFWNYAGKRWTPQNIAILQDTCAYPTGGPPFTVHGTNYAPEGSNILKGDWSVHWEAFNSGHFAWQYNGYYNYYNPGD